MQGRVSGGLCAGMMLGAWLAGGLSAHAAAPVQLDLDATLSDLAGYSDGETRGIAVVGPSRTWLVAPDLDRVLMSWEGGGHAIVVDPSGRLVTCGDSGVRQVVITPEGPEISVLSESACRDIALIEPKDGLTRLVVAGERVEIWRLAPGAPPQVRALDGELAGWPILAASGKRFAVVTEGGSALLEEGPWGTSALATGGLTGGLAMGDASWVWSVPAEDALIDVTRARTAVARGPGALASGDLDGDGRRDLVIAHPSLEVVGLLPGGATEELTAAAPAGVTRVALADLDQDGCAEAVLATAGGRLVRLDRPCSVDPELASVPIDAPVGTDEPSQRRELVLGESTPRSVAVRVGDRLDLKLIDGAGGATAFAASGGPSGLVVTSSGTVLYRARAEDVGTWRVQVRLWQDGSWSRRASFEMRVEHGGALPAGARVSASTGDLASALGEEVGELRRELPIRSCLLGLGGAIGGSRGRSWVTLGEGFIPSGSPAVSVGCAGGARLGMPLRWYAGIDVAPFFKYLHAGNEYRHGISATGAIGYGRADVFVGGYVTAGATVLGVGPMARWMPLDGPSGRKSGFEARLTWMPATEIILEGMLLYTIQIGPSPPTVAEQEP